MTLPFDHAHDLDLGVSRSESEIALSEEWDGRLTWNEEDVNHPSWPWYWLVWLWWGGRMYRIVIGVTSDFGVPSTYIVLTWTLDKISEGCLADCGIGLRSWVIWKCIELIKRRATFKQTEYFACLIGMFAAMLSTTPDPRAPLFISDR